MSFTTFSHKTAAQVARHGLPLPLVAPIWGLEAPLWALAWQRVSKEAEIDFEDNYQGPILPAPLKSGKWGSRSVSSKEASKWLTALLTKLDGPVEGCAQHSHVWPKREQTKIIAWSPATIAVAKGHLKCQAGTCWRLPFAHSKTSCGKCEWVPFSQTEQDPELLVPQPKRTAATSPRMTCKRMAKKMSNPVHLPHLAAAQHLNLNRDQK